MSRGRVSLALILVVGLVVVGTVLGANPLASRITGASSQNPIVAENARPGSSAWHIGVSGRRPALHHEIEGYASSTSVATGEAIGFHVSTSARSFVAAIFRMGWYGGHGARLMRTLTRIRGHLYLTPRPDPRTRLIECHWPTTFTVTIPGTWISGFYVALLTASTGYETYVPFVVRPTSGDRRILVVHSVNTDEAYNLWGGTSLYGNTAYVRQGGTSSFDHRAYEVSFDRPFSADEAGLGLFLAWEYPMIRWLERTGQDVEYATDVDLDEHPSILQGRRALIVVGHSEYWSMAMRNHVEAAIAGGTSLGVFAANTMYWQVRYRPSSQGTPDRVIVCYKAAGIDPTRYTDPRHVTVMFRSPPVKDPEERVLGESFQWGWWKSWLKAYPLVVSDPGSWIFAGTHVRRGTRISHVVGYEVDVVGKARPPGLHVVAASPIVDVRGKRGFADTTLYRVKSGAWVFDAGTIDWSWGLNDYQPTYSNMWNVPIAGSPVIKRITANLFERFQTGS